MRLILARHGETDWNRQRRIQGLSDRELNDTGKKQAEAMARVLMNEDLKAIYTSPLKRARDTAFTIARFHDINLVTLPTLRELDVGEVDGMTYDDLRKHHGSFLKNWIQDCASAKLPGGCTLNELQSQAWSAVEEILRIRAQQESGTNSDNTVVAVTHYFPILSILSKVLGINLSQCRRIKLDVASLSIVDFNKSRPVLISLNETCHLKGSYGENQAESGR